MKRFTWRNDAPSVVWLALALGVGFIPTICASGEPEHIHKPNANRPTAKIVLTADGFAPDEIERLIARPAVEAWVGVEGIVAVTAISEVGRVELYVEAAPQVSEQQLSQIVIRKLPSLDVGNWPAAATIAAYQLVPDFKGPPPTQNEQAFPHVEVKKEVAAIYGLSIPAILEALKAGSPPPGDQPAHQSLEAIRRLTISAPDGRKIPMSEVVTITMKTIPTSSIYRWRQDGQQEKPR